MDIRNEHHISRRLNFIPDVTGKNDTATLPDGIKVHRLNTSEGTAFAIWFNTREEWMKIRELYPNSKIHFYGGNYIYLPPYCHKLRAICDIMGWKNNDKSTWFYPYK